MPQIRSKNSRVKVGLRPAYTPSLYVEPTAEATFPLWQPDGTVRYVSPDGLKWLIENKLIDLPMPIESGSGESPELCP
jgi:hypothetical protein